MTSFESNAVYQQEREEKIARSSLVRTAIIWTPLFAVTAAALIYFLLGQIFGFGSGTWFLVIVLSGLSFLFGYQSIGALRDLTGGTTTLRGFVQKRWSRSDSLVMRTHYIRIEGKIFRINKLLHGDVKQGDDVTIRYYPASMLVVSLERHEHEMPDDEEDRREDPVRRTVAGGYTLED